MNQVDPETKKEFPEVFIDKTGKFFAELADKGIIYI